MTTRTPSAFLDAFRAHAMNQIYEDALEFGIIIKYFGV